MNDIPHNEILKNEQLNRRRFFTSTASGIGSIALMSMLQENMGFAAEKKSANPMAPKKPHFKPTAKKCIFIFLAGAPSQLDLFDPKPKLNELHGKKMPESMTKNVRFAFIEKETARLAGSAAKFKKYGKCGTEFSNYIPHIASCADDWAMIRTLHTDQFNHHPAQLMMNSGVGFFGRPSIGAWLTYGLGSESKDLPGYVVMTAGRGTSGGTTNWTSGFLPSTYQGVLFRSKGEPVLNLKTPDGISAKSQKEGLDLIRKMNKRHQEKTADPEIASRIASYELAFKMQMSAPELTDVSKESKQTLKNYGLNRPDLAKYKGARGTNNNARHQFAKNCLLARRLIERDVRYVNIYHASWDHHSNLDRGLKGNCDVVDQPIGALLKDLKQRKLLDDTLVVIAGEFGRTPLGENRIGYKKVTGRDHHPAAYSILMAGGGVKGGQVIGKTDEIGWAPVEDPVHINDFHATLLHMFGMDHHKLNVKFGGLPVRLTNVGGKIVKKLLS